CPQATQGHIRPRRSAAATRVLQCKDVTVLHEVHVFPQQRRITVLVRVQTIRGSHQDDRQWLRSRERCIDLRMYPRSITHCDLIDALAEGFRKIWTGGMSALH